MKIFQWGYIRAVQLVYWEVETKEQNCQIASLLFYSFYNIIKNIEPRTR